MSPCACKIIGIPLLTASIVPDPPSASLTMQTNLDQALSDTDSGSFESTPTAPSAATNKVGFSSIEIISDSSIAAPKTAIFVSLKTNLLRRFATVTDLCGLVQLSIEVFSTVAKS